MQQSTYAFPTPDRPEGIKIEAKGIRAGLNLVFTDMPRQVVLPALSTKRVNNADNTQASIYASTSMHTAWDARQIDVAIADVTIASWEELSPAHAVIDDVFGKVNNVAKTVLVVPPPPVPAGPGGAGGAGEFQEIPRGAINGVNTDFTLTYAPNPITYLNLYRNGVRQTQNIDYVMTSAITLRFTAASIPGTGEYLYVVYRH